MKVSDLCPNYLICNRCLLPCSLIPCSLLTWNPGLPFPQLIAHPHPSFWDLDVINLVTLLPSCEYIFDCTANDPIGFTSPEWELECWRSYLLTPCGWLVPPHLVAHNYRANSISYLPASQHNLSFKLPSRCWVVIITEHMLVCRELFLTHLIIFNEDNALIKVTYCFPVG